MKAPEGAPSGARVFSSDFLPMTASANGVSFLTEKFGSEIPYARQLRELTKNGIEAIEAYRRQIDPSFIGRVDVIVDPYYSKIAGIAKVAYCDDGIGMTDEDLHKYMTRLAECGKVQGLDRNFGLGARIATLHHNPFGVEFRSWKNGIGHVLRLCRDPETGLFGAACQQIDGINTCTIPAKYFHHEHFLKPDWIRDHGTVVTLLGKSEDDNTATPPLGAKHTDSYYTHVANQTYYEVPNFVTIRTSVETNAGRPNVRIVKGYKPVLEDFSSIKGTVALSDADVHWYVLDEKRSDDLVRQRPYYHIFTSARHHGQVALVFQDEIYDFVWGRKAIQLLQDFGVLAGYNRVALYVEPRKESGFNADATRTRVKGRDGDDIPWERWASEFFELMPPELATYVESQRGGGVADELEYVKREIDKFKPLLEARIRRPLSSGQQVAEHGTCALGTEQSRDNVRAQKATVRRAEAGTSDGTGRNAITKHGNNRPAFNLRDSGNSRAAEDTLATFNVEWTWVSAEEALLHDRAARFNRSKRHLDINEDFDVLKDLVETGLSLIQLPKRDTHRGLVEQMAKRLYLVHLVFAVMEACARFQSKSTWSPDDFEKLVSEEGLTTAALGNPHILNTIIAEVKKSPWVQRDLLRDSPAEEGAA